MGSLKIGTGREHSTDWSVDENITAVRLQDINEDLDDLYGYGSDRGRVVKAASTLALRVDIGACAYIVGTSKGIFAGSTDFLLTDNATNYVELNNAGTVVANTTAYILTNARLARVTTSGGAITGITIDKSDILGGDFTGANIGGFDAMSAMVYNDEGELVTFTADTVNYTLTYNDDGTLNTINDGSQTWTVTYNSDGSISGSSVV